MAGNLLLQHLLGGAGKWGLSQESAVSSPLHSENAISGLADGFSFVPKGWEGEEESDLWPCSFFSAAQHFFAILRWFSTIIQGQYKGSFSTARFLCPTEGCWDPGLPLSQNEKLMAGQIPRGVKAQLALSHTEEPTCQQDLHRYVNLWTEGSFIAI